MRVRVAVAVALTLAVTAAACREGDARSPVLKQGTQSYLFSIAADVAPPRAEEKIHYTIVVRDRKTLQPIQNGEGQIYGGHEAGPKSWDGLAYGPEVGTYHGVMNYAIQGVWDVHVRFRRDSLAPLEDTQWKQDVRAATPYAPPAKKKQ